MTGSDISQARRSSYLSVTRRSHFRIILKASIQKTSYEPAPPEAAVGSNCIISGGAVIEEQAKVAGCVVVIDPRGTTYKITIEEAD